MLGTTKRGFVPSGYLVLKFAPDWDREVDGNSSPDDYEEIAYEETEAGLGVRNADLNPSARGLGAVPSRGPAAWGVTAPGANAPSTLRSPSIDSLAVLANTAAYDQSFIEWQRQHHGKTIKHGSGDFGRAEQPSKPLPVEWSISMYKRVQTAPQRIGVGDRVTVNGIVTMFRSRITLPF